MTTKEMLTVGAIVGLAFILSGLVKTKTCQNATSGNLTALPWYWPCPTGADSITSASTD
jgi:hypothetical protein